MVYSWSSVRIPIFFFFFEKPTVMAQFFQEEIRSHTKCQFAVAAEVIKFLSGQFKEQKTLQKEHENTEEY